MAAIFPSSLSVTDTDNTTFPNTSGGSSNIAEDCPPSGINNALRSVAAMLAAMWGGFYSGTSRPANVQSGACWIDTSGGVTAYVLKYYDGTDDISVLTINRTANTVSYAGALTGNVTGNVTGNADTATALNTTALASAGISDLVGIASQAEAEAGTAADKAMTPLRVQNALDSQPVIVSAAVVFDGTGTPSITRGYNVTSITDNGTGDYTLNFTNALATANYIVSGSVLGVGDDDTRRQIVVHGTDAGGPTLKSTTQLRIEVGSTSAASPTDQAHICVVIHEVT